MEYDSEGDASGESSEESSLSSVISEEEGREREVFLRGDANFPLVLQTIRGQPLVVYQDRAFVTNKRRHNDSDAAGIDTIYMVISSLCYKIWLIFL